MKSLIIGHLGEVGSALHEIINKVATYQTMDNLAGIDKDGESFGDLTAKFDIMHVCIPYSETFVENVKNYQKKFNPTYTVIHSTVPIGTSRLCGALHSPIRGIHPFLAEGVQTFVKFIGGEKASDVADYFRRAGLRVCLVDSPETTEAGKLFDTEYYRVCIEFAKRVKTLCDQEGLNFHEVYTLFNQSYNEGYTQLGHPEFVRPVLQPIMKEIGGHCVLPNKELIKQSEHGEKSQTN